jgi:hypothetical protein
MSQHPNETEAGGRIREEHLELRRVIGWLRGTTDLRVIGELLQTLVAKLPEHFAVEEAPDGVGAMILEEAPRKAFELGQLFREHRVILETVHELNAHALAMLQGVAGLADLLDQHEDREAELFFESHNADLGAGD